jgi:uncharacterized protein
VQIAMDREGRLNRVRLGIPQAQIEAFCQRWQITELALFGSVLREDFGPDSDVDVLVTFDPQARCGLFALARMERELAALLSRDVDLVIRDTVEQSENYIRRDTILSQFEIIYAAG